MRRPHRRQAEYGGTKPATFLWLALVAAIGYFGVMYVPIYAERWEVKSMLQQVATAHWRRPDSEVIRTAVLDRSKAFNKEGKEYFRVNPDDIVVENDESAKKLTLRLTWTRIIPYPLFDKQTEKVFTQEFVLDTNAVTY